MSGKVNRGNARPGVYQEVINKIADTGVCPFCTEHLASTHPLPLTEKEHWIVTDNAYPYKAKKQHLLLIHKLHIVNISELSGSSWEELRTIIINEVKERSMNSGTLLLRFGTTEHTGASVEHLHCHVFEPDPTSPEYNHETGVSVRIG